MIIPIYLFQIYLNSVKNTKGMNDQKTISGFPSFKAEEVTTSQGPLGYMAFGGDQGGYTDLKLGL